MSAARPHRVNVLAIDGGGIRGLIPATILAQLEDNLKRPLCEVFDLIVGTSTGGIIAAAIGAPAKSGKPYQPKELVELYVRNGPAIFDFDLLHCVEQYVRPKYSPKALEEVLLEYFGDTELKSAKTNLLISSYDIDHQMPFFFKSAKAKKMPAYNWKLRDVTRATSAAPTYFPPIHVDNGHDAYTLVDGGVCVNNPSVAGYAEARRLFPDADDVLLVSVGTGDRHDRLRYEDVRHWGMIQWAEQIVPVFMDSVSESADYEMHYILGSERHFRFQPVLPPKNSSMDCVTRENMEQLQEIARKYLRRKTADGIDKRSPAEKFKRVCELLAEPHRAKSAAA